eukprot:18959-Heterococcus_DN1.PRE.3
MWLTYYLCMLMLHMLILRNLAAESEDKQGNKMCRWSDGSFQYKGPLQRQSFPDQLLHPLLNNLATTAPAATTLLTEYKACSEPDNDLVHISSRKLLQFKQTSVALQHIVEEVTSLTVLPLFLQTLSEWFTAKLVSDELLLTALKPLLGVHSDIDNNTLDYTTAAVAAVGVLARSHSVDQDTVIRLISNHIHDASSASLLSLQLTMVYLKALKQQPTNVDKVAITASISCDVLLSALSKQLGDINDSNKVMIEQLHDDMFDIIRDYHLQPEYINKHGAQTLHAIVTAAHSQPEMFTESLLRDAIMQYERQNRDEWQSVCFSGSSGAHVAAVTPLLLGRLLHDYAARPHSGYMKALNACATLVGELAQKPFSSDTIRGVILEHSDHLLQALLQLCNTTAVSTSLGSTVLLCMLRIAVTCHTDVRSQWLQPLLQPDQFRDVLKTDWQTDDTLALLTILAADADSTLQAGVVDVISMLVSGALQSADITHLQRFVQLLEAAATHSNLQKHVYTALYSSEAELIALMRHEDTGLYGAKLFNIASNWPSADKQRLLRMFSNSRYLPADIDVDDNSAAAFCATETSFLVEAVKANDAATTASGMPVHTVTAASFQHALQQMQADESSVDV